MIRVQFCSNSVTMEGHAGYGKKGSDIVCAAVSTLLYVQVLMAVRRHGGILLYSGIKKRPHF